MSFGAGTGSTRRAGLRRVDSTTAGVPMARPSTAVRKLDQPSNRLVNTKLALSRLTHERIEWFRQSRGLTYHGGKADAFRELLQAGLRALNVPDQPPGT